MEADPALLTDWVSLKVSLAQSSLHCLSCGTSVQSSTCLFQPNAELKLKNCRIYVVSFYISSYGLGSVISALFGYGASPLPQQSRPPKLTASCKVSTRAISRPCTPGRCFSSSLPAFQSSSVSLSGYGSLTRLLGPSGD